MAKMTDGQLAQLIGEAETPEQVVSYLSAAKSGHIEISQSAAYDRIAYFALRSLTPVQFNAKPAPKRGDKPSRRQRQRKMLTRAKP